MPHTTERSTLNKTYRYDASRYPCLPSESYMITIGICIVGQRYGILYQERIRRTNKLEAEQYEYARKSDAKNPIFQGHSLPHLFIVPAPAPVNAPPQVKTRHSACPYRAQNNWCGTCDSCKEDQDYGTFHMDCNSSSFCHYPGGRVGPAWRDEVSWAVTRYIIFHALFYKFGEGGLVDY
ncbi:hypothetical protein B9Z19DRAFT_455825 [Tuber borchii]|uniref:Uncharacterized protein n=1 Tax=Tuber borchii TaxID=42251 RepID=A0A2T6ZFW7_TUBBO|nr:hypothetical protein B9Z19DRAFT_455825 [Tuber borchii]